jgi:oligoendopeptidase F
MSKTQELPPRDKIKPSDTWDLSSLFASDADWEKALRKYQRRMEDYRSYQGRLKESAETLAACLRFDSQLDRLAERLGVYAFLKTAEDQANGDYQRMLGRLESVLTEAAQLASFIRPEIMSLSTTQMRDYLEHPKMKPYRLLIRRLRRHKKHTLGKQEEKLLAMQAEMAQASSRTFRQLHDSDLKFGYVTNERGEKIELGNATLAQLLISPKRSVRRTAFHKYYAQFSAHENTFASTLSGSVQKDVYYARARRFSSALDAALFPDNVPRSVYDNLIQSVRNQLPAVHRYYDVRRRKMRIKEIHHYDTYVPILSDLQVRRTWAQAVDVVMRALQPLGSDYCQVLEKGLRERWCDRYPNVGKQSGAFSCGSYDGDPYILMNYKPDVLDDVFTLAHEAGHSMHSYLSAKHQNFLYYDYTIFVAEVASTFNEQLLSSYLMDQARGDRERAYLVNRELDGIRATIVRQTMFAEFELKIHSLVENGEPLTIQTLKQVYRQLLEDYFGPDFVLDDELSLECLRIPHFYRAFYVYKYATGLSAAIALSQRVLSGGKQELADYLQFLKSGCSKDPLDLLRHAGVDMTTPEPVDTALSRFSDLVEELEALI